MKIGILANEFFDRRVGRFGGFGFAARTAAQVLTEAGADVVFIAGHRRSPWWSTTRRVHDTRFIEPHRQSRARSRQLAAEHIDLILTIDYRPSYDAVLTALPRTPVLVWVRDPRTPEDVAKVATLRLPWAGDRTPQGIDAVDCRGLAGIMRASLLDGRSLQVATPEPQLAAKIEATYGITSAAVTMLPNVIETTAETGAKSREPTVLFLGRIDPIKRPWLAVEIARAMPHVTVVLMGRAHLGNALPSHLPPNVAMMGHVDGAQKRDYLSRAWALINTSVHEALAVSFLEALACQTPIVSCQDPGGIVSRFGVFVGRHDGTGVTSVPAFVTALQDLLGDPSRRSELGRTGRQWVAETHSRAAFFQAFDGLVTRAGIHRTRRAS